MTERNVDEPNKKAVSAVLETFYKPEATTFGNKVRSIGEGQHRSLIKCKTCERGVSSNVASCPRCGEKLKTVQVTNGFLAASCGISLLGRGSALCSH